ncbi:MAG: hypothetical protein JJU45_03530 [Acidimicrobiia bacterium]|nr:hypothetical protein [Acidimicrobiia bacterium]
MDSSEHEIADRLRSAAETMDPPTPTLERVAAQKVQVRRRRRRRTAVAGVSVVMALVLAGVALLADDPPTDVEVVADESDDVTMSWRTLPEVPTDDEKAQVYALGDGFVALTQEGSALAPPRVARTHHLASADSSSWEEIETPFEARERAAVVPTPAGLFLWGGNDADVGHPPTGAVYPEQGYLLAGDPPSWQPLAEAPIEARAGAAAAWNGSEVILAGGARSDGEPMEDSMPPGVPSSRWLSDVAAYHPDTDTWRVLPNPLGDQAVGSGSEWPLDDRVVLHVADQALELPSGSNQWQPTNQRPPDDAQIVTALGDSLYSIRGEFPSGGNDLTISRTDPEGRIIWEAPLPPSSLPPMRCLHGIAGDEGVPVVVVGCDGRVLRFDEPELTFEELPAVPSTSGLLRPVETDGAVVLFESGAARPKLYLLEVGGPSDGPARPGEGEWSSFPSTVARAEDGSNQTCAHLTVGTVDREFCGFAQLPALWKVDGDYYVVATQGGSVGERSIPRVESHIVVGKVQPGERTTAFPRSEVPPEWEHLDLGSHCFSTEVADVVVAEHPLGGSDTATGFPFYVTACSPTATTAYLVGTDAQVELRHDDTGWSAVR